MLFLLICYRKATYFNLPGPAGKCVFPPHFVFSTNHHVFGGIQIVRWGFPPYWNNVCNSIHPPVSLYISWTKLLNRFLWVLISRRVNQKLSRHGWVFDSYSFLLSLKLKINIRDFLKSVFFCIEPGTLQIYAHNLSNLLFLIFILSPCMLLLSILLPTLCTYLIKNYHNPHLKPHTLKMSVMHN